ncbi:prepilin-type N-terminal cleavage/methylation domain-containing protein [Serratia sp. UGAL515B_01]|uniref:prepilin-type N-terminal cleavage/methylation domain-containing protein n=1 Tax=Serratia sp. UGAL515B_01 TaxID=2986763 RepID=UPI002955B179|nr:prepilin-type N-terminal cleavage/methylation domain-containing protein [Serratia sp. UGAL515B_01]WON76964.1 prepilin-type N-terminal cleavage/methylation domain-containing protein [Serratia sp. UGAL515B_01]
MINNMMLESKKWQQGFSLIEVIMVLLISTVVIVGGVVYYQTSITSEKTELTILEVMSLLSVIDRVYSPNFQGISSDMVARTCNLPASFVTRGPDGKMKIKTPNGEEIQIKESIIDGKDNPKFFQIIFSVPWRMCTAMGRFGAKISDGGFPTIYSEEDVQKYCDAEKAKGKISDNVKIVYTFH